MTCQRRKKTSQRDPRRGSSPNTRTLGEPGHHHAKHGHHFARCGLRISELCTLSFDCLICDDKHDWYLKFYQIKLKQEHVNPLVNETVVAFIQAQQEDTRVQWDGKSPYLFTRPLRRSRGQPLLFARLTFTNRLNRWALEKNIRDRRVIAELKTRLAALEGTNQ